MKNLSAKDWVRRRSRRENARFLATWVGMTVGGTLFLLFLIHHAL